MFNKPIIISLLMASTLVTACAGNNIKQQDNNIDPQKTVKNKAVAQNNEVVLSDFPLESVTNSDIKADTAVNLETDIQPSKQPKIKIVNFKFDEFDLNDTDKAVIKQHAEFLKANPKYQLAINGHSDYRGPEIYNEKLSLRRANSVATLLISYGAPESQLIINSFGASKPVENYDNWFQNRRVEFEYSELYMVSK
ncbi:MAG: OmpA family protein [Gammaproteobacteria bacterium]